MNKIKRKKKNAEPYFLLYLQHFVQTDIWFDLKFLDTMTSPLHFLDLRRKENWLI